MDVRAVAGGAAATGAEAAAGLRRHAQLADAAQQFEAMMLQEMLKPMRGEGDDEAAKGPLAGGDTLAAFGTESVARAMARGGGFGLARQIIRQVSAEHQGGAKKDWSGTKVLEGGADDSSGGKTR